MRSHVTQQRDTISLTSVLWEGGAMQLNSVARSHEVCTRVLRLTVLYVATNMGQHLLHLLTSVLRS